MSLKAWSSLAKIGAVYALVIFILSLFFIEGPAILQFTLATLIGILT